MSFNTERVLVTGASGFLGAHVVDQLLKAGYRVTAQARGAKVAVLEARYASYGSQITVVGVDDLINGDFTQALNGVDHVLHLASPIPGKMDAKGTIDAAKHGALNVIEQAGKANVKRIVVTSSVAALYHPARPPTSPTVFDENSWSDATEEQVLANPDNAFFAYMASKAIAERAVWDWAAKNPQVDVTTIVPSFMFGPFAPGYEVKKGDIGAMSSNAFPFQVLAAKPTDKFPAIPDHLFLDIREGARAHVVALRAPLAKDVGQKRILVNGGSLSWVEVAEYLPKARLQLRGKLPDPKTGANTKLPASMSTKRAAELLNMQTFKDLDSLMEETADDILRVLGEWSKETPTAAAAEAPVAPAVNEKAGSPTASEKKQFGFKRAVRRVSAIFT